jgi:hypothetical protein
MAAAQRVLSGPSSEPPRLLVISDVAVERTGAGSLLLYRLLQRYPAERLRVVFNPASARGPETRLPGVEYVPCAYRFPRYLVNRLDPFAPVLCSLRMRAEAAKVIEALGAFEPDAVLSVAHGYLWFTAAAVAETLGAPLHLLVHEEWPNLVTHNRPGAIWDLVRSVARMRIAPLYRQAAGRLSVSRGMVEELAGTYGLSSTLLYPNRGDDSPQARVRVRAQSSGAPVVAHTGFIHFGGNVALLASLAEMLGELGGHLDLYTMHTAEELARWGLKAPLVRRQGFFPASEMGDRVAATADALILTASFEAKDRRDVATLFPSKLADYTAIGLPIVTWGPGYSSAARWCNENPGAALVFTRRDPQPVRAALERLLSDRAYAADIARRGVEAGTRDFDLAAARRVFLGTLDPKSATA